MEAPRGSVRLWKGLAGALPMGGRELSMFPPPLTGLSRLWLLSRQPHSRGCSCVRRQRGVMAWRGALADGTCEHGNRRT